MYLQFNTYLNSMNTW